MTFTTNQRVKVIQSTNVMLAEFTEDVGRLGRVLAVDHPSAGIAGCVTVVLDPYHNGQEEKHYRVLRFLNESQVAPA